MASNMMKNIFEQHLAEHVALFAGLGSISDAVESAGRLIAKSMNGGHKLMLCGNGGSAADSQHLAAEFTGRYVKDRRPLAAVALSTDSSALTCIANDYAFEDVFYRQVLALGQSGDCLLAISTSGKSANVIRAVKAAHQIGVCSIGLLGGEGGSLLGLCQQAIVVPNRTTARIQEAHILIGHALCGIVEECLGVS
jgi:D-sedoheptulose 7-phosphate isomerase